MRTGRRVLAASVGAAVAVAVLALLGSQGAAAARVSVPWRDVEHWGFSRFVKAFGRSYGSREEYRAREALYEARRADILAHNADASKTWRRTITRYADLRDDEIRGALGGIRATERSTAFGGAKPQPFKPLPLEALPTAVDWRKKNVVTAVKDQGHCGSCWAFGTVETIESHVALSSGQLPVLSTEQIVDCVANKNQCGGTGGCQGGTPDLVYNYVKGNGGLAEEWTYSYDSFWGTANTTCRFKNKASPPDGTPAVATIDGFVKLTSNDYSSVMTALAKIGPLAVNVAASGWVDYADGVYTGCGSDEKSLIINHVVQLVGYGTDQATGLPYFLVRNTWSTSFGEDGYIRIARQPDHCGVDTQPSAGTGCKNGPANVTVCGSCGILYDVSYPVGARPLS